MAVTGAATLPPPPPPPPSPPPPPPPAAPAPCPVPSDVSALLSRLFLSQYGPALVERLGTASASDLARLSEADLKEELPEMKLLERRRLIDACAAPASPQSAAPAPARPRALVRALVVGINAYCTPVPGALQNAISDAKAVHAALSSLPGAVVMLVTDCGKAAFEEALTRFRDGAGACAGRGVSVKSSAAPVLGLVYFAGHGLQVAGRNYLVPADFRAPARNERLDVMLRDTARACVSLDDVNERLDEAGVSAGSVLLDCCRDVPDFLAELGAVRSAGARALSRGMGDAAPQAGLGLKDLMVTYATAPGTQALDRSSRLPSHSPFTAALLRALELPGLTLLQLNPTLTDAVQADSGGKQRPHVGGSYGSAAGQLTLR